MYLGRRSNGANGSAGLRYGVAVWRKRQIYGSGNRQHHNCLQNAFKREDEKARCRIHNRKEVAGHRCYDSIFSRTQVCFGDWRRCDTSPRSLLAQATGNGYAGAACKIIKD